MGSPQAIEDSKQARAHQSAAPPSQKAPGIAAATAIDPNIAKKYAAYGVKP